MTIENIPVDANASGEIIDRYSVWNFDERGLSAIDQKRKFFFRKESGLIIYDDNNDMFWPNPCLMEWIRRHPDICWYMSSGGTFIIVEIASRSACDQFLENFFPETKTPMLPVGEYPGGCSGRKTFWIRPESRLVQLFGQLIYFMGDLCEWEGITGVSKRLSITRDFIIISIENGALVENFRERIVTNIWLPPESM